MTAPVSSGAQFAATEGYARLRTDPRGGRMESEARTNVQGASGAPARPAFDQDPRPLPRTVSLGGPVLGAGGTVSGMLADLRRSESDLRRFLHGLPGVDQVGAEAQRGIARYPVDQDLRQAVGPRDGRLDGGPHDP